jgi:steroid 5-alpha reductase family enzyme
VIAAVAIGTACVCTMMAALWLVGRRTGNMAFVDAGWAAGLALLGALYAALSPAPAARRAIIAGMALVWGVRLAVHLLTDRMLRLQGGKLTVLPEEGRYVKLRADWGAAAHARFFVFYQAQALLDVLLSAPFFLAARNTAPRLHPLELAAPALLAIAVLGEGTADRQLRRFRADPANKGKTCRAGLWRVSRHPNYFFEWLVWIAFFLLALPAPHGWIAIFCPLLMLVFLFKVTGIPATEAQALRSRGDDYRRYQQETSAFFPWFPRKAPAPGARAPGPKDAP